MAPLYPPPSERFAHPMAGRYDVSTMQTRAPATWEDVERMPDDGNRYEFIGGRLYMTPAPVTRHQRVSKRLQLALVRLLEHPGHGEVRGVREYWIVDPVEDVVDVWRFGDSPGHERFTGEIPVRLGNERVGLINLDEVFSRHLDLWAAPETQP